MRIPPATTAVSVDPERVSMPSTVGVLHPAEILDEPVSKLMKKPEKLVLPVEAWPRPLPRPCYMVPPDKRKDLNLLLLKKGLAVMVPEEDVLKLEVADPALEEVFPEKDDILVLSSGMEVFLMKPPQANW